MPGYEHYHDSVHWHMWEIASRITAASGKPSDRFHLGKIILQSLKDSPDIVAQIDGSTGESETNHSVLQRSIQCAIGLKKMGLQKGDIMIICATSHLDVVVAFYAGFYLGITLAPIHRGLNKDELKNYLSVIKPNASECIIICQSDEFTNIKNVKEELELKAKIITFDEGDGNMNFSELLQLGGNTEEIAEFCPADLDPTEAIATIVPTSGSTGIPKFVCQTHKNFTMLLPYLWSRSIEFPASQRVLNITSFSRLSGIRELIASAFMKFTRVQTQQHTSPEHVYELINKYRPINMTSNTIQMLTLMRGGPENCDFSCFERISIAGSPLSSNLLEEFKKISPKTEMLNDYGMTELICRPFSHVFSSPPESCGKPTGCVQCRLVDVETGRNVHEPNVNGELWLKGSEFFKGYYNNPEATHEAFEEGWYKTGDLFYRDANWNFYFVDRIKFLIKYRNHLISPLEIEAVISQHPGVLDVAVTAVRVPNVSEIPVAFVVPATTGAPTAQDIKNLVKDKLADNRQLRGGVVFLDQLPLNANSKVDRRKIKDMAYVMKRE